MRPRAYLRAVKLWVLAAVASLSHLPRDALAAVRERRALAKARVNRGQGNLIDTILAIGIAGVIGYIILQIGSDTEESAGFNTSRVAGGTNADPGNATAFENASASITEGFETSFGLLDVVFIAFMLAIVVGALLGIRNQQR